eukprot:2007550-Alexandrium_andersonii.AAC.1
MSSLMLAHIPPSEQSMSLHGSACPCSSAHASICLPAGMPDRLSASGSARLAGWSVGCVVV